MLYDVRGFIAEEEPCKAVIKMRLFKSLNVVGDSGFSPVVSLSFTSRMEEMPR